MVNRVAIRWSSAANMPMRSCRFRVGWPTRIPANGGAVHLGVGHEPQFLQLGGVQQVRLIDDEHDAAVPLGGLGGEQVGGLGHQLGLEVAGLGAERPDDLHVEAPGAEGGVGDVDDLVAGGVEGGDGGAHRHGLPGADVAGDHAERVSATQKLIRAVAWAWAWRANRSSAAIALPNGVRASPKCAAHGARLAIAVLLAVSAAAAAAG